MSAGRRVLRTRTSGATVQQFRGSQIGKGGGGGLVSGGVRFLLDTCNGKRSDLVAYSHT